jgi:hypothetical protein
MHDLFLDCLFCPLLFCLQSSSAYFEVRYCDASSFVVFKIASVTQDPWFYTYGGFFLFL